MLLAYALGLVAVYDAAEPWFAVRATDDAPPTIDV